MTYENDAGSVRVSEKCVATKIRIIGKKGPLNNPATRDHCMVAAPLLFGYGTGGAQGSARDAYCARRSSSEIGYRPEKQCREFTDGTRWWRMPHWSLLAASGWRSTGRPKSICVPRLHAFILGSRQRCGTCRSMLVRHFVGGGKFNGRRVIFSAFLPEQFWAGNNPGRRPHKRRPQPAAV